MKLKIVKFSFYALLMAAFCLPVGISGNGVSLIDSAEALSADNSPLGSNIFVEIAKKQNPAVVNVSTKSKAPAPSARMPRRAPPRRPGPGTPPDQYKEFFDRFFGEKGKKKPSRGMGSGFFIDAEGYLLTNHHVVDGADEITVTIRGNDDVEKELQATLVGKDSKTDIALLKVIREKGDNTPFPFLEMGDSDRLEVGEWVVAIGNPFGLSHTVTVGVVSAKDRVIGAGPYDEYIQTDASINPGNSGGPLINIKGQVIGINTAIISGNSGGNVGIGFAMPINIAKGILADLKTKGTVTRGWLGVMIQKITPDLAKSFGLKGSEGALVGDVIPNSPASKAGILRGDVIVRFNNQPVKTMEELPKIVANTRPGESVPVEVIRDGHSKIVMVAIAVLKDEDPKVAAKQDPLGIHVQDITPELAKTLKLESTEGVLVAEVAAGEPGAEAGVRRGDVISQVGINSATNTQPVRNQADYQRLVSSAKDGDTVLLLVKRGGTTIYIAIKGK
jgi:serine protease Do